MLCPHLMEAESSRPLAFRMLIPFGGSALMTQSDRLKPSPSNTIELELRLRYTDSGGHEYSGYSRAFTLAFPSPWRAHAQMSFGRSPRPHNTSDPRDVTYAVRRVQLRTQLHPLLRCLGSPYGLLLFLITLVTELWRLLFIVCFTRHKVSSTRATVCFVD